MNLKQRIKDWYELRKRRKFANIDFYSNPEPDFDRMDAVFNSAVEHDKRRYK